MRRTHTPRPEPKHVLAQVWLYELLFWMLAPVIPDPHRAVSLRFML
jgi:hypothetical protein